MYNREISNSNNDSGNFLDRIIRKLKGEQSYDEIRQRIREMMSHGHLNMGSYSDDVDVKLWLREMNGINVTIFLDRLLEKKGVFDGFVFLVTKKGELNYLSLLNIEDQSSGLKKFELYSDDDKDILVMKVSPKDVKSELHIPNDRWSGFASGKEQPDNPIPWHGVSTEQYNSKYILNFSVYGEFKLEIYYLHDGNDEPIRLFKKGFCCK